MTNTSGPVLIVDQLKTWALDTDARKPRLIALLGEFGMGKTVTCQLFAQALLDASEDDKSAPLPVLFDLRDIDPARDGQTPTLEGLIDSMLRKGGETPRSAKEVIAFIRSRRSVVIFDGLDEVANKMPMEAAIRLYRELLAIAPMEHWRAGRKARRAPDGMKFEGPSIVVSCRTHFFRDAAAQHGFLTGLDRAGLDDKGDIDVYFMLPFTDEQIDAYLRQQLSEDEARRALALIHEVYDLKSLAERPILLQFITATIADIERDKLAGRAVNLARLYDILVSRILNRDNPKHLIPIGDKPGVLRALALHMHAIGRDRLPNEELDAWFLSHLADHPRFAGALASLEGIALSELLGQDLRNASFLVRPDEDAFQFGHTSVREYFLADALYRAIAEDRFDAAIAGLVSRETIAFLISRHEDRSAPERSKFEAAFAKSMAPGAPTRVRGAAFDLWRQAWTAGLRLPRPNTLDLSDLDLSRQILVGGPDQPSLKRTVWRGARLRQTEFRDLDLDGADFAASDASMSRWVRCDLTRTTFAGADLTGSRWRGSRLPSDGLGAVAARRAEAIGCTAGSQSWRPQADIPPVATRWTLVDQKGSDGVLSVALGRLGDRDVIVSGGSDGTVRVWDAESGAARATLEGHRGGVWSVALGRLGDRDVIVSGGDDGTVRVWDAESGAARATLEGHRGGVLSVALGRLGDRDVIVSGGDDGTVRVWDAESGAARATLEGHGDGVWSVALGRFGDRDVIVSGGSDGTVRVWDAESGAARATLEGHRGGVWSVALGRLGDRDVIVSGGDDGTVRVWDAESGAARATLEGHRGGVLSVALGRLGDRDVIVSGGDDGTVRVWDAESGAARATLEGHGDGVWSVALGRFGDRDVIVSGGSDGTVRVWDAESGAARATLEGHRGGVWSVALGRLGDRDVIVSGGDDGTVRVWDAESGAARATLEGHRGGVLSVALGRLGDRDVIVSGGDDGTVRVWDAESGAARATLEGHGDGVWSVALGRFGDRDVIVSGGSDGTVRVWDAESGAARATLEGHRGGVWSVALGRLGDRDVIVSGGDDGTVRVWDAESGAARATLEGHRGGVLSVALGRLGDRDVIVSGGDDGTVRVWDAESGAARATLEGHGDGVWSVALGRFGDRDVIVSGGSDGTVRVWDAESGAARAPLEGHRGGVWSVALGRFGDRDVIVSGGSDGTVRVRRSHRALADRMTIIVPSSGAHIEILADSSGDMSLISASNEAWRDFRAGYQYQGRMETTAIEEMPRAEGFAKPT